MILILRFSQWSFFLFTGMIFMINGCISFRTSDVKVERYFDKRQVPARIGRADFEGRSIRYLATGKANADKAVVFVHGAPGSSNNFHRYLADSALRAEALLLAVDRPGYGYSGYGSTENNLARQAGAIRRVLEMELSSSQKAILVGHSYGGPIVGKAAMDFPEMLSAIVMMAPVNDPDNEPIFWYSQIGRWKATRWMLSPGLKVTADEKFAHAEALEAIADGWAAIVLPVVHIHGRKDGMAPLSNMDFSRKNIPAPFLNLIYLEDSGHFIPWTDYDLVRSTLLALISN